MPTDLATKLQPIVATLANPSSTCLIEARQAAQRSQTIQEIFIQGRTEEWDGERLAEALRPALAQEMGWSESEAVDVALYLAEEYIQIGDSVLIIDRETGRAIAKVTDDDFWQPAAVPREDGSLATPMARLKPEIEGFLVKWQFDTHRDRDLHAKMAVRGEAAGLILGPTDRRLLPVTQAGRKQFVDELRDVLSTVLVDRLSGSTAMLIRKFKLTEEQPGMTIGVRPTYRCVIPAYKTIPIQDPTTFNLAHDRFAATVSTVGTSWVRAISRIITNFALENCSATELKVTDLRPSTFGPDRAWIAAPDEYKVMSGTRPGLHCVVTTDSSVIVGVSENAGIIVVDPTSYQCQTREVHDRWEIVASVEVTLWLNPSCLTVFRLDDVPVTGTSVEIVG